MKKIKTMKARMILTALAGLMTMTAGAQTLTGRDIMQRAKDVPDGDSRYSEMELTLIKKNGDKRERKVVSWSIDEGKDKKTLMFFTYPGDVNGTGFLTWDYDDMSKDDDKWLYLPAMKKTRRISGSSSKTDYFMGTDFTYNDMGSRNIDEDTHTLLREEDRDGQKCWVIESIPVDKREIYSRKVTWIRQDCCVPVYVEFYDKLDKLHRYLTISEISQVQGYWTKQHMEMKNVQTGHSTVIVLKNPQYDLKVDKSMFTVAKLEKGL
jgi:hypothetical protein